MFRSLGSDSSLIERVEALEAAKIKLEEELAEARGSPTPQHTTSHHDMSTSIALCDTGWVVSEIIKFLYNVSNYKYWGVNILVYLAIQKVKVQ